MERRLVAIMAADVVSYSRLMEQDEADTLRLDSQGSDLGYGESIPSILRMP